MMEIGMMVKGGVWVMLDLVCYRGEKWGEGKVGGRETERIHTDTFLKEREKTKAGTTMTKLERERERS